MSTGFTLNDPRLVFDADTHTYRLGDQVLPSVTQILALTGIADFTAPHFTDDVKERGSFIHAAIALDVEGDLDEDTLDPTLKPYVDSFRAWQRDSGAVIEFWERPVVDPVLGYAGTLDGIVCTQDRTGRDVRTVVDVKRALYHSAGPQVAAYRRLAFHLYDRTVILNRAVLELPGDGSYRWHPLTDTQDETTFIAALRVVNWRHAKGMK